MGNDEQDLWKFYVMLMLTTGALALVIWIGVAVVVAGLSA